jgi:hypothetical protein
MFKISPNPTFKTKALLSLPGDGSEKGEIEVEFKYFTPEQFKAWTDKRGDEDAGDVLADIIVGWNGPADADGHAVAYSKASLMQLIGNYHSASVDLISAFHLGLRGAKAKN